MTDDEIMMILQEHKEHLRECKRDDDGKSVLYWVGALDCIDNIAEKLGVYLE